MGSKLHTIKYAFVTSALSYCTLIELIQKRIHTTCVNLFPHISLSHNNSLPHNDAICWYIYWSTMAQMMAWCLRASSLYPNKCWLLTICCQWTCIRYVWELPRDNVFMLAKKYWNHTESQKKVGAYKSRLLAPFVKNSRNTMQISKCKTLGCLVMNLIQLFLLDYIIHDNVIIFIVIHCQCHC